MAHARRRAELAFSAIDGFLVQGDFAAARRAALQSYYAGATDTLGNGVNDALSALDLIQSVDTTTSVVYPTNTLARALKDVAALIKAEIGVKVVAVDLGGWDHHTNLISRLGEIGGEDGDGKAVELNGALKAFRDDLFNSGGTNDLGPHADALHDRVRPPRRAERRRRHRPRPRRRHDRARRRHRRRPGDPEERHLARPHAARISSSARTCR